MTGRPEDRLAELERRIEQLRRANSDLGRQLLLARAGRTPRSANTASRSVGKVIMERDALEAERGRLEGELSWLRHENDVLRAEAHRLRGGATGLLRRLRARLRRRLSDDL